MPLISHRGAAYLSTANSEDAIRQAANYAPDYIEVDINYTADCRLVLHHGSITRFLRGKNTSQTFQTIKSSNPELLSLEDFCKLNVSCPFMFDIKITDDQALKEIISLLSQLTNIDKAFTSPHEKALKVMKHAFPNSPIFQSQPYHHGPISALEIARKNNFEGIAINKWWMAPLIYRLCQIYNKKLMCYTVDSKWGMRLVNKFFPDVYLVTNRPELYRQLFPCD